jgi:hypothetical protein
MVVIRLTSTLRVGNLKYMSRFIFAALGSLVVTATAAAQQVPGRDLFEFPLGLLAEAPALSMQMTGGLWNPATASLRAPRRAAFGFAALTTPQEQGVRLDMVGGALNVRPDLTASLSIVNAGVTDILRTDTDPQSLGGEIPYGTTLLSAGLAASRRNVSLGAALRYRWGTSDSDRSGALATDAGVVIDGFGVVPVRVALSTFLFTPNHRDDASYLAAADIPVVVRDSTFSLRTGYSVNRTENRGREDYIFGTSRYRQLDLSAGLLRSDAFGNTSRSWRLGCGLHYAGYTLAIGREDGAAGIGASYQFLFTRVMK